MNYINFAGKNAHNTELNRLVSEYHENKPEFVIFDSNTNEDVLQKVGNRQMGNLRYSAKVDEDDIIRNSVQVPAMMKSRGLMESVAHKKNVCTVRIMNGCEKELVAASMVDAMEEQLKTDMMQLFLCEVDNSDICDGRNREARGGEQQTT